MSDYIKLIIPTDFQQSTRVLNFWTEWFAFMRYFRYININIEIFYILMKNWNLPFMKICSVIQ